MFTVSHTLPPNATELEKKLALAGDTKLIPTAIYAIHRPDDCPVSLLPYLAWQLSVDYWDEAWNEAQKRQAIKNAWQVHRYKGTIASVKLALSPFFQNIQITEWWQDSAQKHTAGTFKIDVSVSDKGISEADYQRAEKLLASTAPVSRLAALNVGMQSNGTEYLAVMSYDGDSVIVYPYTPQNVSTRNTSYWAIASHVSDVASIAPKMP